MASRAVVLDQKALNAYLKGRNGPVVRDLVRRGLNVESRAKQLCPVDTGRLRSSITTEVAISGGGIPVVRVGTNVDYAEAVHEGTRPHVIVPRNASVLRFPSRGGAIVFTRRVNHPGTRGVPFLRNALDAARG